MFSSVRSYVYRVELCRCDVLPGGLYSAVYSIVGDDAWVAVVRHSDLQLVASRAAHRLALGFPDQSHVRSEAMRFLKQVAASDARAFGAPTSKGGAFAAIFPGLMEYLSVTSWDDGAPRLTATLMSFAEDGVYKSCLNDRESGRSLWAAGASFYDALESLEGLLRSGQGEWRASWGGKAKGSKRR